MTPSRESQSKSETRGKFVAKGAFRTLPISVWSSGRGAPPFILGDWFESRPRRKYSGRKTSRTKEDSRLEKMASQNESDENSGSGKGRKLRKLSGDGGNSGKKALSARARIAVKERGGNLRQRGRL